MGRKRTGPRKQLYFCLAGLIFLGQAGCGILKDLGVGGEARVSLDRGQALLTQGDYEGSLRENQRALSLSSSQPPADEAIFHIGLLYVHSGNPKKDYRRAAGFFRELARDYPRSPWVEQAKIWIGVLEANEKLAQANEKLSETIQKLKMVDMEIEQKRRAK